MIASEELAADEAWTRLQQLLREAATEGPQPRQAAMLYTRLRHALINSDYQPHLPGFVRQCMSIDRFRDFIRLYDSRAGERISFLDRSFSRRAMHTRDFFADADF